MRKKRESRQIDSYELFTSSFFFNTRLFQGFIFYDEELCNFYNDKPDHWLEEIDHSYNCGINDEEKLWDKYCKRANVFIIENKADELEKEKIEFIKSIPKKLLYPKYNREQNKCCKLKDEDIKYIRETYVPRKYTVKMLSKQFNVCTHTINYWLTEERTKKYRKHANERYKKEPKKNKYCSERYLEFYKRKKQISSEYREYEQNKHSRAWKNKKHKKTYGSLKTTM